MSGISDDDPLDLAAVAADERAIEALRAGRAPHDPELAVDLMYALLQDVEHALPEGERPLTHGTTIIAFATPRPERRLARNGTVVAAVTAGLVSLGGVAAAATLAPAGSPLHGLGDAVRSAAGAVVGAVTPPDRPGRTDAARPAAATPTPTTTPTATAAAAAAVVVAPKTPTPGASVSAAARSRAAARQVDALLDDAADLLADGRTTPAAARLDLAERKLTEVLAADRADLPQRLADLRAQTAPPAAKPTRSPKPEKTAPPAKAEPAPRTAPPKAKTDKDLGRQLSKDASMKPRA